MATKLRQETPSLPGSEWKDTNEQKAERILNGEMARRGWTVADLERLGRAESQNLEIATMTYKWFSEHLTM